MSKRRILQNLGIYRPTPKNKPPRNRGGCLLFLLFLALLIAGIIASNYPIF